MNTYRIEGIMRKLSATLAVVLLLGALLAFSGCGGRGILAEYDISKISISGDADASAVYFWDAKFSAKVFSEGDFSMKFRIYVPEGYEDMGKLPVMLFFHGSGERGSNNFSQMSYPAFGELFEDEQSAVLNAIVIAPQCPAKMSWVEIGEAGVDPTYSVDETTETQPLDAALKILKYYQGVYDIDTTRLYAMGISMGGYAVWDILARHSGLLSAAVPICGGCDLSKAALIGDTSLHVFHGAQDTIVLPSASRAMCNALTALGSEKVIYTEYPDGAHDIWNKAMRTAGLMQWMFG